MCVTLKLRMKYFTLGNSIVICIMQDSMVSCEVILCITKVKKKCYVFDITGLLVYSSLAQEGVLFGLFKL